MKPMTLVRGCALLAAATLFDSSPSQASSGSVRAQGMAGAYTATASGIDAIHWNPANLAFETNPGFSFELVSGGARVSNNGIDLGLYNRYSGADLTSDDKNIILSSIPAGGLATNADVFASALGVQSNNLALSFSGHGQAHSNLPHDVFVLLLEGNAVADSVSFENAAGEAIAFASVNLSAAAQLHEAHWGQLHLGINLRYLEGLAYAQVQEVNGSLVTRPSGIVGQAQAELLTAGRGQGMGFDLGLAAGVGSGWQAGLFLENAFTRVNFTSNLERRTFVAETDDVSVATLEEIDDVADLYTEDQIVEAASPFAVSLPRILNFGVGHVNDHTSLAFEYTQGFSTRAGSTTSPRFAVGGELRELGFLPIRLGVSVGGVEGRSASAGLGFDLGGFRLDVAAATQGEFLPSDPKGVSLAVGTGLRF